ncbi:DnaJ domain-containing protein [Nannocystis sp. ILAH1]|uniref:DnaJ domain-containing protein n=1 Tax=Nannocystis sp. ILAH1 TaxID=2996789 RepID=UPI0022700503|nr:DnaJ domain-containing protein [Nannocystis sp. ILAH1]
MTLDEARQILGVGAGAGRDEVKRAHRRLALAFHPDHHKGSTQFDEFQKQINVARDTLNREIDRLAESAHSETDTAMETPAPPAPAAAPPQGPRTRPRPAPPGVDEYREISFPFLTMLRGGRTRINVPRPEGTQEMFVDVPQGAEVGVLLHVLGGGGRGSPPGDLLLRVVAVEPDPVWRPARPDEGRPLDLVTRLTVTYAQLYTERLIPVESPWDGRSLPSGTIGLPLRANNFGPYKVRGHGARRGGAAGDLLVFLDVVWPERGQADLAAALWRIQGPVGPGDR